MPSLPTRRGLQEIGLARFTYAPLMRVLRRRSLGKRDCASPQFGAITPSKVLLLAASTHLANRICGKRLAHV